MSTSCSIECTVWPFHCLFTWLQTIYYDECTDR